MNEITSPDSSDGTRDAAGTLPAAISLLRRGLCSDGSYESIPEGEEAGHQWQQLKGWAVREGLLLDPTFGPVREGGREHDVRHIPELNRWVKYTKPFRAGYTVEVIERRVLMLPATPLQYLERWVAGNGLFREDAQLIGLFDEPKGPRLAISQKDVPGEAPSWDELDYTFIQGFGLGRLKVEEQLGGYDARCYFRGRIGVFDVRPANCVRTPSGQVLPIDVIPRFFGRHESTVLSGLIV